MFRPTAMTSRTIGPCRRWGLSKCRSRVDDRTVVLVDDVIYRGRTIRAAMEAVERLGQPKRIFVAALIDRGARELPIRADIVGKNIEVGDGQRVNVLLDESDGADQVILTIGVAKT